MNNLCPICKNSYPPDVKFCVNDGARLIAEADPAAVVEPEIYNPFEPKKNIPSTGNRTSGQVYQKASVGNRLLAALLDALIFAGLLIPGSIALLVAFLLAYDNQEEAAIALCILGALLLLIPLGFQLMKDGFGVGQSPGKKALNVMVVDLDTNMPCNKQKSCIRNVVMLLTGLVPLIGSFIEPVMVLATNDGRRLGDRAANTMVIDKNEYFN